jgi:SH3 domain protein
VKKLIITVLFTLLAAPAALAALAADRYISDDLFTFMHSGPNNTYRIMGSVNAGSKVQLLQTNKDTGYTQVRDSRGRTGWVQSKFVTNQESMAIRLPRVEKELKEVKEQLANARQNSDTEKAGLVTSLETRNHQISDLEKKYSEISDQLTSAQTENRELRAKLDTQKDDMLLKYFTYGGGVAGIGLLFGLVLPHVMPRRKKSPAGWA